jgi:hypothetical protein
LDEYLGAIGVSNIDKKRITAVRKLEELGYTFANNDWMHRDNDVARAPAITDALHAPLLERADDLEGCTEGSDAEREFATITDAIEAYKAVLPLGRTKDGKG